MEFYLLKEVVTQKLNCLGTITQIGMVINLIQRVLRVMFLCVEKHQSLGAKEGTCGGPIFM